MPVNRCFNHLDQAVSNTLPEIESLLQQSGLAFEIWPCDPELADTTRFCEHYGVALENAANAILVRSKTGDTKKTVPGGAKKSGSAVKIIDFVVSTPSDWTIIPQSAADDLGLIPTGSVDLTGTPTLDGLLMLNMNSTDQTVFDVASIGTLAILSAPDSASDPFLFPIVGPPRGGSVLINPDSNSDFGVLGGAFLDGYAYTGEEGSDDLMLSFQDGLSVPALGALALGSFVSILVLAGGLTLWRRS